MERASPRPASFYALAAVFALFVLFLYGPLSTIFILSFQGSWNELAHFIISAQSSSLNTLTKGVAQLASGHRADRWVVRLQRVDRGHFDPLDRVADREGRPTDDMDITGQFRGDP